MKVKHELNICICLPKRFPTQISNEFFRIPLQVIYINIVGFINFIFNTFMYVSLFMEIDSIM